MEHEKIFLNESGDASFVCPSCGEILKRNLSKDLGLNNLFKINCKCQCGNNSFLKLERRMFSREKTKFIGKFFSKNNSKKGLIKIIDISPSGLKMFLNTKPDFSKGEKLVIEFSLNNRDWGLVKKEAMVKNIKGKEVGVEFINK